MFLHKNGGILNLFGGNEMKKLLIPAVVILLLATGCVLVPGVTKQPPTAYIDSVSPVNAALGETVVFKGHGIDPDGTVGAYSWRSSRDGDLSTAASFQTSSLSPGTHTIWFKVQDNDGLWSPEVLATVIVVPVGVSQPIVNSFNVNPGSIVAGDSSTLSWNVTNADSVSIDPGIGNVSLSGNRVVIPTTTITYTLKATNTAGTVTATARLIVSAAAVPTVELFPIAAESGYVRQDGTVGHDIIVGSVSVSGSVQAFVSFDISMIPKDAVIKSVSLDLSSGTVFGSPFDAMGQLYICDQTYGALDGNDYIVGPPTLAMFSASQLPAAPITSSLMVAAVQDRINNESRHFQIRLQFEKAPFMSYYGTRWYEKTNPIDDIEFPPNKIKLIIVYD
jgi:hypothetical protein